MGNVKLLDCTLRDGGHVNQGRFGKNVIKAIISYLVKAKIDVIEVGFLWNEFTDDDTARFHTIAELKKFLPKDMRGSVISLMADNVDLNGLEPYDGTVDIIRLSFRRKEFDWAEKTAEELKQKGYKVYINPIHGSSYSDEEYLDMIKRVNRIKPYGFTIVDTFGAMRQRDLARIYCLIEHNLDKEITIGVHLHENLGLAYSLAQFILNIASPTRNLTLDGSLFGMGKVPGNLCIEQMIDYLNIEYKTNYSTEPVYDAIDDFIMPIYEKTRWGYMIPYALSAQCGVHRTYAEYLIDKARLHTKDIRRILKSINAENAESFNKEYIENMYIKYMLTDYDDSYTLGKLEKELKKYRKVVVIAPGHTLRDFSFNNDLLKDSCVIMVNFVYDKVSADYYFFSNVKRLSYINDIDFSRMIITSNLIDEIKIPGYIVSRNELSYHDDIYCDDSTLMVLNLLRLCGKNDVLLVGFDGFKKNSMNFYETWLERKVRDDDYDQISRIKILREVYSKMNIKFLTPSIYEIAFEE